MTFIEPTHDATVHVHYPISDGRIVLRCDPDWDTDLDAHEVVDDGQHALFRVPMHTPYRYFKPVWLRARERLWARGKNYLAVAHAKDDRHIYPYFFADDNCTLCDVEQLRSSSTSAIYTYRVFTPPGYEENTLKRYPVLYLQDGQNVFFPSESFSGADWRIPETLSLLTDMNVIDKVIAVGIYSQDREHDYTQPGYEDYGRFVTAQLKPEIDRSFRTLTDPVDTALMGASLGGVVSLYLAWQWPEVFGNVACLSSTFGWRDDLYERLAAESRRRLRFYLDSGWPQDNYEVTRDMQALLRSRGYALGRDLLYFAFPGAAHHETAWALRSHLPFQFLFGAGRST